MDWQTILLSIIGIVLTAFISWASERLITFINTKISDAKQAKYLTSAVEVVTRAVKSTYQTYVESLKGKDMFDSEAQKQALQHASDTALTQLSADTQLWVEDNFGNVHEWISNTIESVIYDLKNKLDKSASEGRHESN